MKDIIKISWRNLWRNRRRTIITAASIYFAVFFAITMRSFQLGTYNHMIKQLIESFTGYLQIQNSDYLDDPGIDNVFPLSQDLISKINADPNVKVAVPRIESFALVSTGNLSKGIILVGISPEKELQMSDPKQKLVRYRFTKESVKDIIDDKNVSESVREKIKSLENQSFISKQNIISETGFTEKDKNILERIYKNTRVNSSYLNDIDDGVLISDRLSKYLKINIGDSIVLMGQGYQGVSAAGVFPVKGIVRMPSPDIDNKLIYMSIARANEFLSLSGQITSIAINLKNPDEMKSTQSGLSQKLDPVSFNVRNWEEITPTLKQQIEGDNKSGLLFLAILYVIIFFGIYGTVQMMISERMKEFGVMVAIGMKRRKLAGIVTMEMMFLGMIGAVSGMLSTVPVLIIGHYHPFRFTGELAKMYMDFGFDPVMPMALFESYFFSQGIVIFIMILAAIYLPVRKILKLNVIKAIHG